MSGKKDIDLKPSAQGQCKLYGAALASSYIISVFILWLNWHPIAPERELVLFVMLISFPVAIILGTVGCLKSSEGREIENIVKGNIMKLRYRTANYIIVLLMQWALLIPGTMLILSENPELRAYSWIFAIYVIIPPIFTVFLYNRWLITVDKDCFHLSPPLKRKRAELCFKDITEIVTTRRKGEEIIEVLKDSDSNLYQFGRLLDPKDSARLWNHLSRRIEEMGLDIEIKTD